MEAYISNRGLPSAYDCHTAVNYTFDEWLEQGEPHVALGIATLVYGFVTIALYIPCCIALMEPDLRSITAYKLLFLVSIFQIISLVINSLIAGIFFIQGVVYCNYPDFIYFVGCVTMTVWSGVCITCFILGLSRLVDLWSPSLHDSLFGGRRVIYSLTIIFIYITTYFLYAKPAVFNSREWAWIFDPLVYPDGSHFMDYACFITVLNNEGTVGLTLSITFLFIASFAYKSTRYQFKMSSSQKQLFVQSTFSSLSSLTTASIYVSFAFISAGRWWNYLGLLTWQIASAGELVLFLFINRTIRGRVLILMGFKKSAVGSSFAGNSGVLPSKSKPTHH